MQEAILYERALAYAAQKHRGQTRIGGEPFITHPVAVAELLRDRGYDIRYRIAGLFHDLLEDTDAKEDEIASIGGQEVLETVRLLTKREGYCIEQYVAAIRKNPMAFAVKGADRLHNLRSAVNTPESFRRRYIEETIRWYLDFMPEIRQAVRNLVKSLPPCEEKMEFMGRMEKR